MASGTGSPCGACKFLRRKCTAGCIFAPYFCSEQGPARFAAIHKVFGASNVSKLLLNVPVADRCETVVTLTYEAESRIKDPVYGCAAHIYALQQHVAFLQAQLMQAKAQLAQNQASCSGSLQSHQLLKEKAAEVQNFPIYQPHYMNPISPTSSFGSVDHNSESAVNFQEIQSKRAYANCNGDLGELHELALRMMRNE